MEKETIILGAGESGVGAALLAQSLGRRVFVSDAGTPADHFLAELMNAGIEYEAGGHDVERILFAEIVIKSPGIPDTVALIQAVKAKGIEVISEIEYAYRFLPPHCRVAAITGSNGKTTTTSLVYHLLAQAGLEVMVGGNIGISFARMLTDRQKIPANIVLELSSFQLDGITTFRPQIAALLNITPDHLDRYDHRLENYAASKFRIAAFQQAQDTFLYFQEDPYTTAFMPAHLPARAKKAISIQQIRPADQLLSIGGAVFSLANTQLRGKHNALNALFAIAIAQEMGLSNPAIQAGLESFQTVPHRMEEVAKVDGVTYINDSKATNVDAVAYALDAMRARVVWIAGGTDKGNDYTPLLDLVEEKVHTLICLGIDNQKLRNSFSGRVTNLLETQSVTEALAMARQYAYIGDTVLLSPACASFDLFKNYIDRGDQFRAAAHALAAAAFPSPNNKDT